MSPGYWITDTPDHRKKSKIKTGETDSRWGRQEGTRPTKATNRNHKEYMINNIEKRNTMK